MVKPTGKPWRIEPFDKGFSILGTIEEGPFEDHNLEDIGLNPRIRSRLIATVHGSDDEARANAELIIQSVNEEKGGYR